MTAAAAKNITEDVTEDIADITVKAARTTRAALGVHPGMAILVICSPLLRIFQDLVRFFGFLEVFLRRFIIRIAVRMMLHGLPAIGFFQLIIAGGLLYAKDFVVVPFCHTWFMPVVLLKRN